VQRGSAALVLAIDCSLDVVFETWVVCVLFLLQFKFPLEIIFDLPFGFPINNIISLQLSQMCTHVYIYIYMYIHISAVTNKITHLKHVEQTLNETMQMGSGRSTLQHLERSNKRNELVKLVMVTVRRDEVQESLAVVQPADVHQRVQCLRVKGVRSTMQSK